MAIKVVLLPLTLFIIISLQTVEISFVKQNLIGALGYNGPAAHSISVISVKLLFIIVGWLTSVKKSVP